MQRDNGSRKAAEWVGEGQPALEGLDFPMGSFHGGQQGPEPGDPLDGCELVGSVSWLVSASGWCELGGMSW